MHIHTIYMYNIHIFPISKKISLHNPFPYSFKCIWLPQPLHNVLILQIDNRSIYSGSFRKITLKAS